LAEKEQGTAKIHYAVESGEKLYPSTASEGRDIIRQELRGLRDQWEQVSHSIPSHHNIVKDLNLKSIYVTIIKKQVIETYTNLAGWVG